MQIIYIESYKTDKMDDNYKNECINFPIYLLPLEIINIILRYVDDKTLNIIRKEVRYLAGFCKKYIIERCFYSTDIYSDDVTQNNSKKKNKRLEKSFSTSLVNKLRCNIFKKNMDLL